jgi:NTP pyrophosphatase (non-canonical NTP hydrolase)
MKISELVKQAHATAKAKGWWDKPRSPLECMALIHSEVSESVEDIRLGFFQEGLRCNWADGTFCRCLDDGNPCKDKLLNPKPVGLPSELADVIIRIADFCGHEGIDLEAAIKAKMAYNKTRAYRHGGKAA